MENSIFSYDSYRDYMHLKLSSEGKRGQLSKAAIHLNCQSSFLSRVINSELQLTPDHAYKLSQFWNLSPDERQYFIKLVEHERAGDHEYRSFIGNQIRELKRNNSDIGVRTRRNEKNFEGLSTRYFSSWMYSAVHFLTSIPEFQKQEAIQQRLNVPTEHLKQILEDLKEMDFIKQEKNKWIYQSGEFHLKKSSPLVLLHHQNWRQRALVDAQLLTSEGLHYTTILTMSKADVEKLKDLIINFFDEINRISAPSNPEEEMVFVCDFFKS